MQRCVAVWFVCAYLLSDVICSILPFPLYDTHKRFNIALILNYLLLLDGYDFTETPIDFLILAFMRFFILVVAISLKIYFEDVALKQLLIPLLTFSLFSWAFTIIKLLAFAENAVTLYCIGPWLSLIWNVFATGLLLVLWRFVLMSAPGLNYERLLEHHSSESRDEGRDDRTTVNEREGAFDHAVRLLRYCKTQWMWFLAGLIFLVIQSVALMFLPYLTGQVISSIVQVRTYDVLVRSVIWMTVLSFITVFFDGLRAGCFDYATALVNRQIRCDLFRSLVKQEIAFFDSTRTGEITSRLTADCQTMSSTVSTNLNTFMRNGLMLVGALVIMSALSWRLTMVTFMIVPVVAFATRLYGLNYDKLAERTQSTVAGANEIADEVMSTMRTVRSFACESRESDRFEKSLDDVVKISKKKSISFIGFTWVNAGCDRIIEVAVLCYGGHLVLSGKMTPDNLIAFLLYQIQLGENLYYLGTVFAGLMESVGASRKVFEYMLRKPTVTNTGSMCLPVKGLIRFEGVSFAYPSRPKNFVLKAMSFTIYPGETVALVGPSGGGKSSIVALIEHFYNPNSGNVFIDGMPVSSYDHEFIHQKIALVAQEPVLYDGSVRYNILYGMDNGDEETMIRAAKMANVHDFVMETENQYDTNCGEKGVQMSGGQKQRIAIARALVRDPAVLILDEATSALDAESERIVQEAITASSRKRTIIVIAHRLSTVEKADRIFVVNKGQIVQQGRHGQLLQEDGLYRTLVQRQLLAHNESDT
uniref:Uncharacterized protein n=1 Tax=Parascaris univalens TaxID=6257 RepID=A0A915AK02_PARUN